MGRSFLVCLSTETLVYKRVLICDLLLDIIRIIFFVELVKSGFSRGKKRKVRLALIIRLLFTELFLLRF